MKYFSTFSGIGGFELGIQLAYELHNLRPIQQTDCERPDISWNTKNELQQWKCVGYSEIDKYASSIYQKHFPTHHNYGDITKIVAEDLPDFDLLVGGFPCQSFSIAGKRMGFEDTRGTMFFELARILRAKQPRLFVFENVKGLLSHDNGQTFRTIISTLDELGYDLQWQVLNSKNHGVPQNRERVFIVGHLRGTPRPQVFPLGNDSATTDEVPRHVSNTLTRRYEQSQATGTYIGESKLDAQEADTGGQSVLKARNQPDYSNQRGGSAHTTNIRRLTPVECMRLQGFPDDWCDGISDTQKYKCAGNAVTVNVIRDIFEKILSVHNSTQTSQTGV